MPLLTDIPQDVYVAGHYDLGEFTLPASWNGAKITINPFNWPDIGSPVIHVLMSVSDDNFQSSVNYEIESFGGTFKHSPSLMIPNIYGKAAKIRVSIDLFTDLELSSTVDRL